ncbi:ABC transporter ATP-binding protein [Saccharopolyspora sp. NFXS83]|uniref:energy-coupling factor ABC transporter ATP-binding protein n=1 Tax=Saccharopolyspora sp. NFXS83 TaxID=2993560 RepID=UPI00224ABCA5|nr:ABC transporter ATP-binding protein [Saccharopolyspora sp. NFXS83]MCX2731448.1 ABC transporter ATP-binding protein [Saccharopolyspora sp. NFXS83]
MRADIRVESLTHDYDAQVTALRGITTTVRQGERVAVIGPNGAGKTTLVQHFNGLARPTSGRVLVGGMDTAEHSISALAAEVGFVFQNPADQLHARTVAAEVRFGPRNLGHADDVVAAQVAAALAATGLTGLADAHPYHLAPAQRKLVAIASVLAMDTPVVVLDEPTTGQDAFALDVLSAVVEDLAGRGRTVIATTHDMDFCVENFDRVLLLTDGELIADGTPAEVFTDTDPQRLPQLFRLSGELGWGSRPTTVDEFVAGLAAGRAAAPPGCPVSLES